MDGIDKTSIIQSAINTKILEIARTSNLNKNFTSTTYPTFASQGIGSQKECGPVAHALWKEFKGWVDKVGKQLGLPSDFSKSQNRYDWYYDSTNAGLAPDECGIPSREIQQRDSLIEKATTIANNYKNMNITDRKTSGQSSRIKGNKIEIGPFKYEFDGQITKIDVKGDNSILSNVSFGYYEGSVNKTYNKVSDIKSNKEFYVYIPISSQVKYLTSIKVYTKEKNKSIDMYCFKNTEGKVGQELIYIKEYGERYKEKEKEFTYNISLLGNLEIEKVDKNATDIKLPNVKFKLYCNSNGKWVKRNQDGSISYVSEANAEEMKTDYNGKIAIKNLIIGKYTIYEKENPNYGYIIDNGSKEVTIGNNQNVKIQFTDTQKYIRISGYVWKDAIAGKESLRDNIFTSGEELLAGIKVVLKNKTTGAIVKGPVYTNEKGAYLIKDVERDKLSDYYIEFEYDGLTYTNVDPHVDRDNGSKAAENTKGRNDFNNKFSTIKGTEQNDKNKGLANNHGLNYNEDHTLNKKGDEAFFNIQADTTQTSYSLSNNLKWGMEEIKNINLGLYEREQPDISLVKDIENVKLSINGYDYIYNYAKKLGVEEKPDVNNPEIGIKYKNKYTGQYKKPIYSADYYYENPNAKDKELKVEIMYKIRIINESTHLVVQVNDIADYMDSKYINGKASIEYAKNINNGKLENIQEVTNTSQVGNYYKTILPVNEKIGSQKYKDIYIKFTLNRETVKEIITKDKEELRNIAEINSYSVFDTNNNVYAGIDKDSNPGNLQVDELENSKTWQDDTDSAPGLLLEDGKDRSVQGNVFYDKTNDKLTSGEERKGDGIYDTKEEKGVSGVTVKLIEILDDNTEKLWSTETSGPNGEFKIKTFIPGKYKLVYEWKNGNKTQDGLEINVQNYKGTTVDENRWNFKENNGRWYENNVDVRESDAIDNYEIRTEIDNELTTIKHNTTISKTTMKSTTPQMIVGIENTDGNTSNNDALGIGTYEIKNIDFGIAERPRQQLALKKRVKTFKIKLANGQIIADVQIDKDGKMTGEQSYVTYMKPNKNMYPKNGWIKAELDNELLQGSILDVTYGITIENTSEWDYLNENYYHFGTDKTNPLKLTPTESIDYMDKGWSYQEINNGWKYKDMKSEGGIYPVSKDVIDNTKTKEKTIVSKSDSSQLLPGETADLSELNTTKMLASTDDIKLDNESEIIEVNKNGGGYLYDETPGNYIPGSYEDEKITVEPDSGVAETVMVVPATGENRNYIAIGILGISIFAILGTGIYLIKKKVL